LIKFNTVSASVDAAMPAALPRREFLKVGAAGAITSAIAGSVLFHQSLAYAEGKWGAEADVVVVGSGAAGCAAALFAHEANASVVMLEKALIFGGTTAKSGGVFWIPNNYAMRERSIDDPEDNVLRYLARVSFPTLYDAKDTLRFGMPEDIHALHVAFYRNASLTIDRLREMGLKCETEMTFDQQVMPDYNAQLPENFDRRWRTIATTRSGAIRGGMALVRQLMDFIEARRIPVLLSHRVVRLVLSSNARVIGVEAITGDNRIVTVRAKRGVIFGSGGFTANTEMCLNYLRGVIFGGCAAPTNEGDLVPIATSVRAKLANMNHAWFWSVIVEQALQFRIVPAGIGQIPGDSSILVNAYGTRCVNEKIQYNERTQVHFVWDPVRARYPNHIMIMLYDQSCRERFADSPIAQGIGPGLIAKDGTTARHIMTAATLDGLTEVIRARLIEIADRTGNYELDPAFLANLKNTIERFNGFAATGVDLDFHRGEAPIELAFHGDPRGNPGPNVTMRAISAVGPYYAVMLGAGTLDTKGGPKINPNGQILDVNEQPIAGLYGAGNCVGSPAGQGYWSGGGTIGLALTFGALAGRHAAISEIKAEAA
jgi:3-oxosteroid 1-dehydrogenase